MQTIAGVRSSSSTSKNNNNNTLALAMLVLLKYAMVAIALSRPMECGCHAFVVVAPPATTRASAASVSFSSSSRLSNTYDDWRTDVIVPDTMHLDEDNVQLCLDEFVDSEYGTTMFGCHDKAAQIGITGSIDLVEVCGPEVTLALDGAFWHKRSTVLGRAAVWLNARIPEITDVVVSDLEDLEDFEEIVDEFSGEVLFRKDKRSEDFNGDRATMEYQGLDPDARGPFPQNAMGSGGSMINPA